MSQTILMNRAKSQMGTEAGTKGLFYLDMVLEETGFDVSEYLDKDEYIEVIFGQQRVRLYIIAGVGDDTSFAPLTKKEISEIAWQRLDDLQPSGDEVISRSVIGLKLYMVAPFLKSLRSWISKHASAVATKSNSSRRGFTVWKAKNSSLGSSSAMIMVDNQQTTKFPSDPPVEKGPSQVAQIGPGITLRNFKFNAASILQAMESGFST